MLRFFFDLPTFWAYEFAWMLTGAHFALGVDTLLRLVDTRYYGNEAVRDQALEELLGFGVRFVVFGRRLDGRFTTLADVADHVDHLRAKERQRIGDPAHRTPVQ